MQRQEFATRQWANKIVVHRVMKDEMKEWRFKIKWSTTSEEEHNKVKINSTFEEEEEKMKRNMIIEEGQEKMKVNLTLGGFAKNNQKKVSNYLKTF